GVKFHDGTPFNAQAVAFNIMRQKDPNNHCRCAFYIQSTEKVEAVDDLTVVFHLRDPAVEHPSLLAPPAVTNAIHSPPAIQKLGDDYNRNPVGTSPFVLRSRFADHRLRLEPNPHY